MERDKGQVTHKEKPVYKIETVKKHTYIPAVNSLVKMNLYFLYYHVSN